MNPGPVKITVLILFTGMLLCAGASFWLKRVLMPEDVRWAESLILDKKWTEAIVAFENLAKTHPDQLRHKYNLGNLYFLTKNYPKAEEAYTQVLNATELEWRKFAIYNLGDTAFCQNRLKEAIPYFDAAHAMDSSYDKARLNADFTKQIREQMQNQPDLARERLKESCLKFNQDQKQDKKEDEQKKDDDQKDKDKKDPSEKQNQKQKSGQDQDKDKDQQKSGGQNQDQEQNQNQQQQKQQPDPQQQGQGEQQPDSSSGNKDKNNSEKSPDKKNDLSKGEDGQDKKDGESFENEKPHKTQEKDGQNVKEPQSAGQNGKAFHGKKDPDAEHWLYLLDDDPGRALQYMIRKKAMDKKRRFDKNW